MDRNVINQATSIDDAPTPTYLLEAISPATQTDPEKILDYLLQRLEKLNINIKFKALNVINYCLKNGNQSFENCVKNKLSFIQKYQDFSGPTDPVYGMEKYYRIQATSNEILNYFYLGNNTNVNHPQTWNNTTNNRTIQSNVQSNSSGLHGNNHTYDMNYSSNYSKDSYNTSEDLRMTAHPDTNHSVGNNNSTIFNQAQWSKTSNNTGPRMGLWGNYNSVSTSIPLNNMNCEIPNSQNGYNNNIVNNNAINSNSGGYNGDNSNQYPWTANTIYNNNGIRNLNNDIRDNRPTTMVTSTSYQASATEWAKSVAARFTNKNNSSYLGGHSNVNTNVNKLVRSNSSLDSEKVHNIDNNKIINKVDTLVKKGLDAKEKWLCRNMDKSVNKPLAENDIQNITNNQHIFSRSQIFTTGTGGGDTSGDYENNLIEKLCFSYGLQHQKNNNNKRKFKLKKPEEENLNEFVSLAATLNTETVGNILLNRLNTGLSDTSGSTWQIFKSLSAIDKLMNASGCEQYMDFFKDNILLIQKAEMEVNPSIQEKLRDIYQLLGFQNDNNGQNSANNMIYNNSNHSNNGSLIDMDISSKPTNQPTSPSMFLEHLNNNDNHSNAIPNNNNINNNLLQFFS